jgi:3-oxoacyl-[acyl-carrier-protein] synthase-3
MPKSTFEGIRIVGVAGAVPDQKVDNLRDHTFIPEDEAKKIVGLTGVKEYRRAPDTVCSSDLCAAAAEALLDGLGTPRSEIDAVVFATMTPDFRVPSTACVLQDRLGLSNSVVAYDVNMGCSGFIIGLYNACALLSGGGLRRVLVLAGDTQTKLCHREDKNVVFIMGDGGTATLVERDDSAGKTAMEVFTDGSRYESLYVPAGGFRQPSTEETRQVKERPDGGFRSDDDIFMNGMEIFKFSSTDVVKSIARFMEDEGLTAETVDDLFLHQANQFMNDKIARKLGFGREKVPYTIQFYGNTGSASIPITMAHHLSQAGKNGGSAVLSGFGVGLSWGIASLNLSGVFAPPIVEVG